tara:strand:- start:355 stop:1110 length:756 start_codon:yes stop_codon:yes gene_type:complete
MSYLTNPYRYVVAGCSSFPDSLTTSATGTVDGATIAGSGKFDNCTSYDGVDDFIAIDGVAGTASFSTNVGCIALWVKVDSPAVTDKTVFCFGDTNADTFLRMAVDGDLIQFWCEIGGVLQWEGRATGGIPDDTWTSIIFNKASGVDVAVYVNGSSTGVTWNTTTDLSKWVTSAMDNFRLGCRNFNNAGNNHFFEGFVDDFLITDTALTSDQMAFLQTNPASSLAVCDGIKAYYNCNEFNGSGNLVNNASPT